MYALPLVLFAIRSTLIIEQCKFDVVANKGISYCLVIALLGNEMTVKEAADIRIQFADIACCQGALETVQL